MIILCLYVDDLLITSNNECYITEFKVDLMKEFKITDLDLMTYFLGVYVCLLSYVVDKFDDGVMQRRVWSCYINDRQHFRHKSIQDFYCTWEKQVYRDDILLLEKTCKWRKVEAAVSKSEDQVVDLLTQGVSDELLKILKKHMSMEDFEYLNWAGVLRK